MRIRAATVGDADAVWSILEPIVRAGETYALPQQMGGGGVSVGMQLSVLCSEDAPLVTRADLASGLDDVRHRFVFNGTWDSTAHTSDLPRSAKTLLGGWEISGILKISKRTVDAHARSAVRKLGAANRMNAVAIAIRDHLVRLQQMSM